jgi:hypothetical protein
MLAGITVELLIALDVLVEAEQLVSSTGAGTTSKAGMCLYGTALLFWTIYQQKEWAAATFGLVPTVSGIPARE